MSTPHPYTLLLFEDDPFIRDMLVVFFTAQGLTVRAAADGRNALARIRAEQPDLILLDVVTFDERADHFTGLRKGKKEQPDAATPW